jgi:hypothetical protein
MTDLVGRTLDRLATSLPGQVSTPGDAGYAATTAIWSKPVGLMPRAIVHCRTAEDALCCPLRSARGTGGKRKDRPLPTAGRTGQIDPKHAFKVSLLDGREGRESGHTRYE